MDEHLFSRGLTLERIENGSLSSAARPKSNSSVQPLTNNNLLASSDPTYADPTSTETSLYPTATDMSSSAANSAPSTTNPAEPDPLSYYYGLPSRPKLVATTSPWIPRDPGRWGVGIWPVTKCLRPVLQHDIIEQWDRPGSKLRKQIIEFVDSHSLQWRAIDILRIGYVDGPATVTMFISVHPASTSPDVGKTLVEECKSILHTYGIHDVECDMKESVVTTLNNGLAPASGDFPETEACYQAHLHRTGCIGTTISAASRTAAMQTNNAQICSGTKGLYLRLLDTDRDEENRQSIVGSEKSARSAQDVLRLLRAVDDPLKRIIGHVQFCAPYSTLRTEADRRHGWGQWLRDWAFIELDQTKHKSELSGVKNTIRPRELPRLLDDVGKVFAGEPDVQLHIVDMVQRLASSGPIRLQGVLHESSLRNTRSVDESGEPVLTSGDDEFLMVGKFGMKSGLTFGFSNGVKSVIRRRPGGNEVDSEEWYIVGWKSHAFSDNGDSGSAVWDMTGRVAGLITSGLGNGLTPDVTYATTMSRLLEDFEAEGFTIEVV
ncbi:hypothetical protein HJFPF1_08339 [Paramyrothecium foliicola]|nr:hypothetical protein HJFPF1_08339 [Paramyrothecium foliicola]